VPIRSEKKRKKKEVVHFDRKRSRKVTGYHPLKTDPATFDIKKKRVGSSRA